MKLNIKYIALLFTLFTLSIATVSASDIDNETLMIDDNANNDLYINKQNIDIYKSNVGTFSELQKLIWGSSAGDTIILDKDYELDSELTRQHIIIDRSLTIIGNEHTLDGKNTKRIFYIEPQATNTVLKNINFVNGYHTQAGSAIFWRSDYGVISDCTFTNNVANQNGGAVYWSSDNGTITNCIFNNNKAGITKLESYQSGGAIYWEGNNGKVLNNQFIDNFALTNGGAITWKGTNGEVSDNIFTDNLGKESGGAIYWDGSNALIENNNFTSNTCELSGGAIYYEAESGTVKNNNFIKNTAKTNAGAIRWNGNRGTVTDNYFESNDATLTGGAIYWEGTKGTLSNNIFIKNKAHVSAGAILFNGNSATLNNNNFTENSATNYGGAIYFKGNDSSLTKSQFKNNKASKSGGAIYWEGRNGQLNSNTFEDSISSSGSGGAIRWDAINGSLTDNIFKNCQATSGGAIYWEGNNGKLIKNTFTKSTSSSAGGAVYWNSNNAEIIGNSFDGSTSTKDYGGAIYFNGASSKINNNDFINNKASKTGGAIYYNGDGNTANNNIFLENTAQSGSGGAIRWNGNQAILKGNTFEDNTATYTGNAIYGEGDNAEITKNTFIKGQNDIQTHDWRGSNNKISDNIYGNSRETTIAMQDLTIFYGGSGKLVITLTDKTSKALAKKDISLTINNGVSTVLSTDGNGKAEYEVKDLTLGTYKATAKFAGNSDYDASTATATITAKSTIESKDLTAEYGSAKFNATFFDSTGKVLAKGESVSFTVDNDAQRVQVGDNGVATITVKKAPGDYTVNILNTKTGETVTNKLKITKASANLKVTAKDIAEGENAVFDITSTVQNAQVTLTINGANYPATLEKGKTKITVSNLTAGKYPYTIKFAGNENYTAQSVSGTLNVKSDTLVITAPDLSKYFGGSERFVVKVSDKTGAPISGITITILINGVQNNRTVENGEASIGINLMPGNYTVLTTFKGNADYNPVNATSTVTVKTTNIGKDVSKIEKGPEQYVASFTDGTGKKLTSGTAIFNINGVFYYRDIDSSGQAKLNLRLGVGQYVLTAYNPVTNEQSSNIVKINSRFANNSDVTKYYRNATQYHITLLGDDGKAVGAGEKVTFNINGVFYERTTDENGTASLNINLMTGDYVITAIYKECMISNKIKVLSIIKAQDIVMSYRDGTQFKATLLDGQGKPFPGQNITLNINGVFYPRVTDNNGMAALTINLMPGQYIITSYYETFATSNKITIR